MTVRRVRYAKIDRLVEHLLVEHAVSIPPIPVQSMLSALGVKVKAGKLGDISGLLARSSANATVGVNSDQSPTRQRFTMAHEFGHFLLHEGVTSHSDKDFRVNYRDDVSSQASNVEEMEANYFAASLLMPKLFLDRLNAENAVDSNERVTALAKTFRVSPHAMSLRLTNVYERYRPF